METNILLKGNDLSTITKSDLFANLLPDEEKSVIDRAGIITLQKGAILFSPGDKAEHLYFLREGLIRIFTPLEDGREEEIARFAPGDTIGDFDFARGGEYDAHAQAMEDSTLVIFPAEGLTIDDFAREMPRVVARIFLNSAAMVTARIKSTRKLSMENMPWVMELHRKAYEDPGTGLWKRTFIDDEINRILKDPVALILLKPDRFKILVDTLGHDAGDKAMIQIAAILKTIPRRLGRGWALRFTGNETGLFINKCGAEQAESLAQFLFEKLAALPPVSLDSTHGQNSDFRFSGSVAWGIWPLDNEHWPSFFDGTYKLLMDTWKAGGNRIVRYQGAPE